MSSMSTYMCHLLYRYIYIVVDTAGGGAGSLTCSVWPLNNNVQGNVLAFQMFIQLTCAMWLEWTTIHIHNYFWFCKCMPNFKLIFARLQLSGDAQSLFYLSFEAQCLVTLNVFYTPRWMAETFAVSNIEVASSLAPSLAGVVAPSERSCDTPLSGTAGLQQLPAMC